jgi:dTDP-4-dehydrorhamnose 3,5-epimerase-like enzyme
MIPKITAGNSYSDSRGTLFFNNDFDASAIKRIYTIENSRTNFIRGWQGHKIEQRWFVSIKGSFRIQLLAIDNWDSPSRDLEIFTFVVNDKNQDILHIPRGYVSSIQSLEEGSRLLVMADYRFGEIQDEYRFEVDYFK